MKEESMTNNYCNTIEYLKTKSKTHVQLICEECGLWKMWEDRETGYVSYDCDCRKAQL